MILTNEQEKALKIILEKYKNHEKYVTICGFAGVGKSTLVKFAIEALDIDQNRVAYACYTGKAAEVLRRKGNKNAMTLHKLLYDSIPRPGGGFLRKPKMSLDYDIVVVDEISLAPKSMIDMLLKHNVFCIFIGDNFQLPQIDKTEAHDYLEHPDIFLSTIMRQALESEIIRLTMKIREGKPIEYTRGNEVIITSKKELVAGHLLWADQIICGTNSTRYRINKQMRDLLGYYGDLQNGEKIIIKRNYWDECNIDGDALVNGIVGVVDEVEEKFITIPNFIKCNRHKIPVFSAKFNPEYGDTFGFLAFDKDFLLKEEPCVDWRVSYQIGKMRNRIGDILPKQATYGYAITCHAAQGSEWSKVLVIEETFPFDREEHKRWLYTAVSRSSEKCVLIR